MKSVDTLVSVVEGIKGISEAGLSFSESETLKFLKAESERLADIAKELSELIKAGNVKDSIQVLTKLIIRVNVVASMTLQPAVISSLSNQKIRDSLIDLLGSTLAIVEEAYLELIHKVKDVGLKSFTLNINTNPFSVSLSLSKGD